MTLQEKLIDLIVFLRRLENDTEELALSVYKASEQEINDYNEVKSRRFDEYNSWLDNVDIASESDLKWQIGRLETRQSDLYEKRSRIFHGRI